MGYYPHFTDIFLSYYPILGAVDVVDGPPVAPVENFTLHPRLDEDITLHPRLDEDITTSYPMTSHPRGWCFIINNIQFTTLNDRHGSEKDATVLQKLFTSLGYRIWLVNNVTTYDLRERLSELVNKPDHGDCLVICILSHGSSGQIYGVGGQLIPVAEILDTLYDEPLRTKLNRKPKLFLIQACRDSKPKEPSNIVEHVDTSQIISEPKSPTDEKNTDSAHHSFIEESKIQAYTDLVLAYSTFPGEISWRHTSNGSFFIDSVNEIFSKYSSSEDVLSMLVKVNALISSKLSKLGIEQIPAPVFTLTTKMFLK